MRWLACTALLVCERAIVKDEKVLPMAMVEKIPEESGWYWAKHFQCGLVITNVQIVDGVVYVMDSGYTGWNRLFHQFTAWSESPIPEPES